MGTIDEVKQMQAAGKSEQDIRNALQSRGVSSSEIDSSLSQAQIQQAVSPSPAQLASSSSGQPPSEGASVSQPQGVEQRVSPTSQQSSPALPSVPVSQPEQSSYSAGAYSAAPVQQTTSYQGMQPSMMQQPQPQGQEPYDAEGYSEGGGYAYDDYPAYQSYSEGMSSDVISEIAEQVVSERLSILRGKLDEALEFRTSAETRLSSLHDRLERLEKIIDRLQLHVLQKVGDYVNDVRDIKHELVETQKSFHKLAPALKKHHSHKRKSVP